MIRQVGWILVGLGGAILIAPFLLSNQSKNPTRFNKAEKIEVFRNQQSAEPIGELNDSELGKKTENKIDEKTHEKLARLEQVLSSNHDHHPELDTEFRQLTPALKTAMVNRYHSLDPSALNQRGTLVFILGREIQDSGDLQFFRQVLTENSKQPGAKTFSDDLSDHYPSVMAIRMQEERVKEEKASVLRGEVEAILSEAASSPNPVIAREAKQALGRLR